MCQRTKSREHLSVFAKWERTVSKNEVVEKALECAILDIISTAQRLRAQISGKADTDPRFPELLEIRHRLDQLFWREISKKIQPPKAETPAKPPSKPRATPEMFVKNERGAVTYNISTDFSRFPGGVTRADGENSAEDLREILAYLINNSTQLILELDGTLGYASNFLKATFGGLCSVCKIPFATLEEKLALVSANRQLANEIWIYINEAK